MMSAADGWALAWTSNPADSSSLVLARTTDGGRDWLQVALPGIASLPQGQVVLDAVSAQRAWLAVGNSRAAGGSGTWPGTTTVYGTDDGGLQWRGAQPFPGSEPAELDFIAPQRGWLLENLGAAMGQDEAALWRAQNDGTRWSLAAKTAPIDTPRMGSKALPSACDKTGVAFASARVGWITSFCNSLVDGILVSRDGGEHWSSQPVPVPASACQSGCDVQAAQPAGSTTFLQIDGYPSAAYLLVSRDAGRTWTVLRLPAAAGPYPRSQFFGPEAGIVIAAGSQGAVGPDAYVTSDGGQSWTPVPLGRSFGNTTSFDFVSTGSGFAWMAGAGSPVLYQTTDSGRAWTSFVPALTRS
jgi:photosystem II stability/assembly factor-like uncharacterized protein